MILLCLEVGQDYPGRFLLEALDKQTILRNADHSLSTNKSSLFVLAVKSEP
jgi:hypothetical protein